MIRFCNNVSIRNIVFSSKKAISKNTKKKTNYLRKQEIRSSTKNSKINSLWTRVGSSHQIHFSIDIWNPLCTLSYIIVPAKDISRMVCVSSQLQAFTFRHRLDDSLSRVKCVILLLILERRVAFYIVVFFD